MDLFMSFLRNLLIQIKLWKVTQHKNSSHYKYGLQGSQCLSFHTVFTAVRFNLCMNSVPQLTTSIKRSLYYQYSLLTSSHQKQIVEHACPSPFRLSQPTPPHYEHKPTNLKDSDVILSAPEGSINLLRTAHIEWKQNRHEQGKLGVKRRQTKANLRLK